ncbi:HEAT repeat domain-containing protein [Kitasatospora sp. NPDC007106]|uniref:HEAT repeat domain-containing protein n=1 Tax=Kitasatospora sp. NPDC007106 TaxID=3156914 RepID=UPI0033F1A413
MNGTDEVGDGVAVRAELRRVWGELDAVLAAEHERGPGAYERSAPVVDRLRTPDAAFLRPELEDRLARFAAAGDSFGRDRIAHVLAGACGEDALPALLRARVGDRNEDGDTLELDVLDLFHAWPAAARRLALEFFASADAGARLVGIWSLGILDFGGREFLGLVAGAATDPEPRVRAGVMSALGTIFGTGDPDRARAVTMAGTADPAPEVRRAAVSALGSTRDEEVTALLAARAGDPDRQVRVWVAWSLSRRPEPTARTAWSGSRRTRTRTSATQPAPS